MIKQGPNLFLRPFEVEEWPLLDGWFYSGLYPNFFIDQNGLMTVDQFKGYAYIWNAQSFVIRCVKPIGDFPVGTPVGMVMVYDIKTNHKTAKIGVLIDNKFQNEKFCLEAMWIVTDYLINSLGFRKLIIEISPEDHYRMAFFEKTEKGVFTYEAVFKNEVLVNGKERDMHRWILTNEGIQDKLNKIGEFLWHTQQQPPPPQLLQAQQQLRPQLH